MAKDFRTAVADRRTYYGISKESNISDAQIQELIEHAIRHTPSAFNSQSTRIVLLLGAEHDKLWNFVKEALKAIVPADQFEETEGKINSFQSGYGTVLFFDENAIVEDLQSRFALYKDNFPVWAQQSNGMHQFVIWTALEEAGFGASLQHYSEVVDAQVRSEWNIPASWKFIAQMPFGKPVADPGEKAYAPIEDRFKIYK